MSPVVSKSIVLDGHTTSVGMEDQLWAALKEIAAERELTLAELITAVDYDRGEVCSLSSALRTLVLGRHPPSPPEDAADARSDGDRKRSPA